MPTNYSFEAKGKDELYKDVTRYIQNCIDAICWRDRVVQVKRFKDEED